MEERRLNEDPSGLQRPGGAAGEESSQQASILEVKVFLPLAAAHRFGLRSEAFYTSSVQEPKKKKKKTAEIYGAPGVSISKHYMRKYTSGLVVHFGSELKNVRRPWPEHL